MSLLLDEPRVGAQEPAVLHLPPDVHSLAAADEAIELADSYGVCDGYPLAESQRITLRAALGERADGTWAATRVGDFGPRQGTGKSDKIAARELAGLILFDEQLIIHTAHEFPTANESFLRLVAVFENWDDLRKRVARIRYANGEQGIELLTGQRLKYRARTGGSGRGFAKADLVVYDEAQHLSREHVAASGPAKLANPNSQTWYAGSGGLATSLVAWGLRRDAVFARGGRLAYTEATAERPRAVADRIETDRVDPYDVDAWYAAIPGLGRWVTEESVRALLEELGPELFAREVLCAWDAPEEEAGGIFPVDAWKARLAPAPAGSPAAFAVDMTWDREWASIDVCAAGFVDVVEHAKGAAWVVGACAKLQVAHPSALFGVHPKGPAGVLIKPLREAGVRVEEITSEDYPQACAAFYDAVVEGTMTHSGHPALNAAVAGAMVRGGETWVWDRKHGAVISPLVAGSIALWLWERGRGDILNAVW